MKTHENDETHSGGGLKRDHSTLRGRDLSLIEEEEDESHLLLNFSDRQDNLDLKRKQTRMFETSESQTGRRWDTGAYDRQLTQYEYQIVPSGTRSATFQCNMLDIHFDTPGLEHQTPGYYIRLETLSDKHGGQPGGAGAPGHPGGGVGVIAKVNKMMKQAAF